MMLKLYRHQKSITNRKTQILYVMSFLYTYCMFCSNDSIGTVFVMFINKLRLIVVSFICF